MIKKVHLKYFKRFKDQSFELEDTIVLAGPNNSGKTTLIQAIATWYFAFTEWQKKKGASKAKKPGGVSLIRQEFLSLPVRRFNLLWTDASTALKKEEGGGRGAATPRIMEITLEGYDANGDNENKNEWKHTIKFRYSNPEQIYATPGDSSIAPRSVQVVYVPPFSGIETEEKVHTPEYQDWLIGQGKPGDIIRNLLVETSMSRQSWKELTADVEKMFGYRLLKPQYKGRPFILCEYLPGIPEKSGYGGHPKLDIASAGSGFLQALILLSFLYARPSSILLIDEPDAHLHVVLQKQMYDHLREVAAKRKCQIIVATHSEVIIDNTSANKIISFYDKPHRLLYDSGRDEVREALKRLTSMDLLQAKSKTILYVEDHSDFNILRAWTNILQHPFAQWCGKPFYFPIKGNNPKEAKNHFFALRAVTPDMRGVLLLDGDNRDLPTHEVSTNGLEVIRWERYEIESYLVHYDLIKRFLEKEIAPSFSQTALEKLRDILSPAVIKSPLDDHAMLKDMKASKDILPVVFEAAEMNLKKPGYYKLAEAMTPDEIHPEVINNLEKIHTHFSVEKA